MSNIWNHIIKLKDVDEIFDLICFANYVAGSLKTNIPVESSRKAFKRIKTLLRK